KASNEGLEPTPHHETSLFNLFGDSVGHDDIDENKMKRVENVDVAEMVEAMGAVSNMIVEGNDAAFDMPCNEIATGTTALGGHAEKNINENNDLNEE
ncbi:35446_t:CDS:2, partial [Gigaspora margarita]